MLNTLRLFVTVLCDFCNSIGQMMSRHPHVKSRRYLAATVLATFIFAGCGGGGGAAGGALSSGSLPPTTSGGLTAPLTPQNAIKHIVIIVQENRTPDNLFQGLPGADIASSGLMANGQTVALKPQDLGTPEDLPHGAITAFTDIQFGKMDGFSYEFPSNPTEAYSYVPRAQVQPYYDLASTYTFADRMFQSNAGPSFSAHQYIIAGQSGNTNDNPQNTVLGTGPQWGCGAPAGTFVSTVLPSGKAGPNVFPCFDYLTLADTLASSGHTWNYYAPQVGTDTGYIWSAYQAIRHIRYGPAWGNVISPETQILTDAAHGLPSVTWVTPSLKNSDHRCGCSIDDGGPSWVAQVVNAIGESPDWNSTAIFITWDDWGGFYDHVQPKSIDAIGLGLRVPLIVVSPFAKRAYVSHVPHEFGSILHFAEEVYGLPSLGTRDAISDDLMDCFDFTKPPAPFIPLKAPITAKALLQAAPDSQPPDDD